MYRQSWQQLSINVLSFLISSTLPLSPLIVDVVSYGGSHKIFFYKKISIKRPGPAVGLNFLSLQENNIDVKPSTTLNLQDLNLDELFLNPIKKIHYTSLDMLEFLIEKFVFSYSFCTNLYPVYELQ